MVFLVVAVSAKLRQQSAMANLPLLAFGTLAGTESHWGCLTHSNGKETPSSPSIHLGDAYMHKQPFNQQLILAVIQHGPEWIFATIALIKWCQNSY